MFYFSFESILFFSSVLLFIWLYEASKLEVEERDEFDDEDDSDEYEVRLLILTFLFKFKSNLLVKRGDFGWKWFATSCESPFKLSWKLVLLMLFELLFNDSLGELKIDEAKLNCLFCWISQLGIKKFGLKRLPYKANAVAGLNPLGWARLWLKLKLSA